MRAVRWMFASKKRAIIVGLAVAAIAATSAYAVWQSLVQQPASAGKLGTVSVVKGTTPVAGNSMCYPGASCDGVIELNNTSGTVLHIKSFTGSTDGTGTQSGDVWAAGSSISGSTGCSTITNLNGFTNHGISIPAQSGLNINVPVGDTQVTIPNLYSIDPNLPTSCQGANFVLVPAGGFVLTITQ